MEKEKSSFKIGISGKEVYEGLKEEIEESGYLLKKHSLGKQLGSNPNYIPGTLIAPDEYPENSMKILDNTIWALYPCIYIGRDLEHSVLHSIGETVRFSRGKVQYLTHPQRELYVVN